MLFNSLEEAKSFKDNPEEKKKYSITMEFSGTEATLMRSQLLAIGKPVPPIPAGGTLKVTFYRQERLSKPKLVGPDKVDIPDDERPRFLPRGSTARVAFSTQSYPTGISLVVEAVMVVEMGAGARKGAKKVHVEDIVDPIFEDIF